MKLSKVAILAIRGSEVDFKRKLADALGVTQLTMYRYISANDDNLTKAAAMELIRAETGLTDNELLEKSEAIESEAGR